MRACSSALTDVRRRLRRDVGRPRPGAERGRCRRAGRRGRDGVRSSWTDQRGWPRASARAMRADQQRIWGQAPNVSRPSDVTFPTCPPGMPGMHGLTGVHPRGRLPQPGARQSAADVLRTGRRGYVNQGVRATATARRVGDSTRLLKPGRSPTSGLDNHDVDQPIDGDPDWWTRTHSSLTRQTTATGQPLESSRRLCTAVRANSARHRFHAIPPTSGRSVTSKTAARSVDSPGQCFTARFGLPLTPGDSQAAATTATNIADMQRTSRCRSAHCSSAKRQHDRPHAPGRRRISSPGSHATVGSPTTKAVINSCAPATTVVRTSSPRIVPIPSSTPRLYFQRAEPSGRITVTIVNIWGSSSTRCRETMSSGSTHRGTGHRGARAHRSHPRAAFLSPDSVDSVTGRILGHPRRSPESRIHALDETLRARGHLGHATWSRAAVAEHGPRCRPSSSTSGDSRSCRLRWLTSSASTRPRRRDSGRSVARSDA